MECEKSELITKLQTELSHANDLLTSARHRGALPLTEGEVLSLSPVASSTSSLMESGLTLTQIYSRYVETMSLYRDEKDENTRLTNYLHPDHAGARREDSSAPETTSRPRYSRHEVCNTPEQSGGGLRGKRYSSA